MTRRELCTWLIASAPLAAGSLSQLSREQKERFLLKAQVVKKKRLSVGITGSHRLTLTDGALTHDAHLQTVDIVKRQFSSARGTELNFRDSYKYNIAAYRIDKLLGLNVVPVSVERKVRGERGAVTWWVDNVLMMEKERHQKKIGPPDLDDWNDQMFQVRVFNELVYNTDPNLGNLLITTSWRLRMIDFTRAFRWHGKLRSPGNLRRIDRRLYEGLQTLSESSLKRELDDVLNGPEIQGVLARRDKILEFFQREIARRGEPVIICSLPGH